MSIVNNTESVICKKCNYVYLVSTNPDNPASWMQRKVCPKCGATVSSPTERLLSILLGKKDN